MTTPVIDPAAAPQIGISDKTNTETNLPRYDGFTTQACLIGIADKGPAFVPIRVSSYDDFKNKLVINEVGTWPGLLASNCWFGSGKSGYDLTYVRLLGIGSDSVRKADGTVADAGFVVGEEQPAPIVSSSWSPLSGNAYAFPGGPPGRTYFLGTFMSATLDNRSYNRANKIGVQSGKSGIPFLRGILMAPSGVVLTLKNDLNPDGIKSNLASSNSLVPSGTSLGTIRELDERSALTSQFVLLLNGHRGTGDYPNVITASLTTTYATQDVPYYIERFNTDPLKIQEAGHYLYAHWDMPGFDTDAGDLYNPTSDYTPAIFLVSGSCSHNSGSTFAPNYESFENRFTAAKTPWVVSQKLGRERYDLFRLHLLDDGAGHAERYNFIIENLKPDTEGGYGTFDLKIVTWDSNANAKLVVVATFRDINLDPSSQKYIARQIGDNNVYYELDREPKYQKLTIDGDFFNQSSIVRVEVHPNVSNATISPTALPTGFRGISHLVTSGSSPTAPVSYVDPDFDSLAGLIQNVKEPPLPFRLALDVSDNGTVIDEHKWGVLFREPDLKLTNKTFDRLLGSVKSYTKYFPDYRTDTLNFCVGNNPGAIDPPGVGTLDSDAFNNNLFTLENINVMTTSAGAVDNDQWAKARYRRDGTVFPYYRRLRIPDDINDVNRGHIGFAFFAQGGFNGTNIFDVEESRISGLAAECDFKNPVSRGRPTLATYEKCLQLLETTDQIDFRIFAMPDVRGEYLTKKAIRLNEEMFDSIYLMDVWGHDRYASPLTSSAQTLDITSTAQVFSDRMLNSSFVAAYFPDVEVNLVDQGLVVVPPSAAALGVLSQNDLLGKPWHAPAGEERGGVKNAISIMNKSEMEEPATYDVLAKNRINAFKVVNRRGAGGTTSSSIVVNDQKTTLLSDSSLLKINVRRLLIEIRREVRAIAERYIFEQNDPTTAQQLKVSVEGLLARYQESMAITAYKVSVESGMATNTDIEEGVLRVKVVLRPFRSAERVIIEAITNKSYRT